MIIGSLHAYHIFDNKLNEYREYFVFTFELIVKNTTQVTFFMKSKIERNKIAKTYTSNVFFNNIIY